MPYLLKIKKIMKLLLSYYVLTMPLAVENAMKMKCGHWKISNIITYQN